VENAGLEFGGPNRLAELENAGPENAGQNVFDVQPLIHVYFTGF